MLTKKSAQCLFKIEPHVEKEEKEKKMNDKQDKVQNNCSIKRCREEKEVCEEWDFASVLILSFKIVVRCFFFFFSLLKIQYFRLSRENFIYDGYGSIVWRYSLKNNT